MSARAEIRLRRGEAAFDAWTSYMRAYGRHELANAADAKGELRAQCRWPNSDCAWECWPTVPGWKPNRNPAGADA